MKQNKDDTASQNLASTDSWSVESRRPYIDERIIVHFKAGNIRQGRLRETNDNRTLTLEGGADTGVYELKEILDIETDELVRKQIYP